MCPPVTGPRAGLATLLHPPAVLRAVEGLFLVPAALVPARVRVPEPAQAQALALALTHSKP